MNAVKMSVLMTAAIVGLTGCTAAAGTNKNKETMVSIQSSGSSDFSNHNSKGAMASFETNQNHRAHAGHALGTQSKTIDEKTHRNTYLSMNREVADQVMQAARLGSTVVAMTDTNIYVAVDMGGMKDNTTMTDQSKQLSKNNDPTKEAGLFGSGMGAQMDWVSAKPIPMDSSNAIRHLLTRIYPDSTIYISSNPLFVNRMMYYDMQQRNNKRMDTYLNEFNTMVKYAFNSSK
ncbi:hypothetical protein A8709_26075 [Paenibacillus pectinilyticus]|uniref:Sporulation protein n=1 Tax=Paenibacillus pectinilyticus TaxID=512399 RepID=A0A1C1A198_9BACL|nr:hypothetical protein [Paenibacillus pectinilyticus]OCT14298.1 hypothetical protein A8709_26075 [Paenibacillus pectinilyticus]